MCLAKLTSATLCCGGSLISVHQQYRLRGIRIRVGIAEGGVGAHCCRDGQSVELDTIPAAVLHVPSDDGFFADQIHLAICEALPGVDVGATGFNVVAVYLLGIETDGQECDGKSSKDWQAETHKTPHPI